MAIPDSFLDDLNSRLNIVDVVSAYVPLTKRGGNYWGLCPFHHEKTPSFSVNESRQIFHCFGCGKGGGPARFLMEMESLSFPDAVRKLADQAGLPMPEDTGGDGRWRERRRRVLELNREAARQTMGFVLKGNEDLEAAGDVLCGHDHEHCGACGHGQA